MPLADTIKTFLTHHLPWVIITVAIVIGGVTWLREHDARLLAEQHIAVDEQKVKTLQDAITQNNQTVANLQQQMEQRDAANAQIVQQLLKAKQQAVTPPQQVQVLQTEAKLPAPITSIPGTADWRLPEIDVQPLFNAVSDGLVAGANLTTCQADLKDETKVAATNLDNFNKQVAITAQKDDEIKTLRKKPGFMKRFLGNVKQVVISAAVGYFLGGHKF